MTNFFKRWIGNIFLALGVLVFIVAGIWGLILTWGLLIKQIGFVLTLLAFLIYPATFGIYPWYLGLVEGFWDLLIINYGGFIIAMILYKIGSGIKG